MPRAQNDPKVSVIITTYNRANLLPRAVNSVLAQTYSDYEIIIVDDESEDNTQEVIRSFDDPRVRSFKMERNGGASAARNLGIGNAHGKYIGFLDDDDEWLPRKLERQVALFDSSDSKLGLVYGWVDVVNDSTGQVTPMRRIIMEGDVFDSLVAMRTPGPTSVLLVRTLTAREVGGFDESLPRHNDIDFICRISACYHIAGLPEVVAHHHTEHGHKRISDDTPESLSKAANQLRRHIATYADELEQRPKSHAAVLRSIAVVEMTRGNHRAALGASVSAFRLDPAGVCHAILSRWRIVMNLIVRAARNRNSTSRQPE